MAKEVQAMYGEKTLKCRRVYQGGRRRIRTYRRPHCKNPSYRRPSSGRRRRDVLQNHHKPGSRGDDREDSDDKVAVGTGEGRRL